eukprot:TRINITY_DN20554_c0_g1_i1.p2 TRINITY_DN20554_c0_g1~~TRINITY_DN20554_c0_g1_i1.p2  ORF type:complete len:239 (+),score=104.47 TRINITY_DN20554_c0_g1_i1:83-799(+)
MASHAPVDLASLRKLFQQLDTLVDDASGSDTQRGENKQLLLREFSEFFRVQVNGGVERESLWMPLDDCEENWNLSNGGRTVTMSACAGWRSLTSRLPLGEGQDQIFVTLKPHALRILTIGLAPDVPECFVGDSDKSYAYQSTGHMVHGGTTVESHPAPTFEKGDTIGILLDKKQKYIAFYKNTMMAGIPFTDVDPTNLRLVISCYMGPCSVSVDFDQRGSDFVKAIKTFPICIDTSAE